MKSTQNPKPAVNPPILFPILMSYKNDSFIVLFSSRKQGTVIWSDNKTYEVGHASSCWSEASSDEWKPFNAQIILEN